MELNQERFFIKSQLTGLNTIAKKVHELKYDISIERDPVGARNEIAYLQTFCTDGFPKMAIDVLRVHPQNEDLVELWHVIYAFVMRDYEPAIIEDQRDNPVVDAMQPVLLTLKIGV